MTLIPEPPAHEYQREHRAMLAKLVSEPYRIRDSAVLRAMAAVPRHPFVPAAWRDHSYDDCALPLVEGQTISQPYIVAAMTEMLELTPESRVLEVGTGCGYQAAVLAEIAAEVYSIEIVFPLAARAAGTLHDLGYDAIHLREGDGHAGWPEAAPFDGIIVTCAPVEIPEALKEQLTDGGRLVTPVGTSDHQVLRVIRRWGDRFEDQAAMAVRFVPMTN